MARALNPAGQLNRNGRSDFKSQAKETLVVTKLFVFAAAAAYLFVVISSRLVLVVQK
jgi:hypothetical protein